MLVTSFNLLQSFNYTPYLFYKKRFKSEINSFSLWIVRRYNMNGRDLKCREVKLDFAETDKCKPVLLSLSLAEKSEKNHVCRSMGLNGGSVATDSDLQRFL